MWRHNKFHEHCLVIARERYTSWLKITTSWTKHLFNYKVKRGTKHCKSCCQFSNFEIRKRIDYIRIHLNCWNAPVVIINALYVYDALKDIKSGLFLPSEWDNMIKAVSRALSLDTLVFYLATKYPRRFRNGKVWDLTQWELEISQHWTREWVNSILKNAIFVERKQIKF